MKKHTIYGMLWSGWLGVWLGSLNVSFLSLKFWVIFLPIAILASLENDAFKNNE